MNEFYNNEIDFGFKLDDFQAEAIEHIDNGKSVVVCAPTEQSRTLIAEYAVRKVLKTNKRIFYTTPLKALSNQKFNDFSNCYGADKVGLLTGDISINREAQIVVMTTEVFRNMLYGTNLGRIEENLKGVQYVALDEVHYMNDEQRGTVWEESIIYCPNHIQLIALSATIANADKLTDWINSVHGKTELVYSDFRPVPLRHYYYSPTQTEDILALFAPGGRLNSKIKQEKPGLKFAKRKKNILCLN
ncbi:MAG: DEAD/DEAH box helicase [Ignavibacteriales bacterium]|nr:DEAD/DEAH box helicase [Ignavibacteriales bacterium]